MAAVKRPHAAAVKRNSLRATYNVNSEKSKVFAEFSKGKFASELIAEGRFPDLKESTLHQYYYEWKQAVALREAVVFYFVQIGEGLRKEVKPGGEKEVIADLTVSLCKYALNTELTFYRRDKAHRKLIRELVLRWRSVLGFKLAFYLSSVDAGTGVRLFDRFIAAMQNGCSKN